MAAGAERREVRQSSIACALILVPARLHAHAHRLRCDSRSREDLGGQTFDSVHDSALPAAGNLPHEVGHVSTRRTVFR